MKKNKVAFQGELGAYSHIAINELFEILKLKHVQLLRKQVQGSDTQKFFNGGC